MGLPRDTLLTAGFESQRPCHPPPHRAAPQVTWQPEWHLSSPHPRPSEQSRGPRPGSRSALQRAAVEGGSCLRPPRFLQSRPASAPTPEGWGQSGGGWHEHACEERVDGQHGRSALQAAHVCVVPTAPFTGGHGSVKGL